MRSAEKQKNQATLKDAQEAQGKGGDSEREDLTWDHEETKEVISVLADMVEEKGSKLSVAEFYEELRMMQLAKDFDNKLRMYVGLQSLFGASMDGKKLTAKKAIIKELMSKGNMPATDVLWAFDVYLEANQEFKARTFAMVLKALYDEDLLEESDILSHYNGGAGTDKAKKAAEPFLEWLQKA